MWHDTIAYFTKHDTVLAQVIAFGGVGIAQVVALTKILIDRRERQNKIDTDDLNQIVADNSIRDGVNIHILNQAILDAANVAIIICTDGGNIFQWNDAACAMFGWTEHEVRGKSVTVIIPPHMHGAHLAGLKRYVETKQSSIMGHTIGIQAVTKNGRHIDVCLTLSAGEFVNGDIFFCGIITPLATLTDLSNQEIIAVINKRDIDRGKHKT